MWGDRERIEEEVTTQQILQGDKRSWKLITVHGNKYTGMVNNLTLKGSQLPSCLGSLLQGL